MVALVVLCPCCGKRLQRAVNEECPPSHLRCKCGAILSLEVHEEPGRDHFPDGLPGQDGEWEEEEMVSDPDLHTMLSSEMDAAR